MTILTKKDQQMALRIVTFLKAPGLMNEFIEAQAGAVLAGAAAAFTGLLRAADLGGAAASPLPHAVRTDKGVSARAEVRVEMNFGISLGMEEGEFLEDFYYPDLTPVGKYHVMNTQYLGLPDALPRYTAMLRELSFVTDDAVLKKINRGCTTADAARALRRLKDACFKVDIHLMPNLPGSSLAQDAVWWRVLKARGGAEINHWVWCT